jgi:hypothetical protein
MPRSAQQRTSWNSVLIAHLVAPVEICAKCELDRPIATVM